MRKIATEVQKQIFLQFTESCIFILFFLARQSVEILSMAYNFVGHV